MKVEITSTIDIADSAPSMPIVRVVEGEIRDDLSDHVANRLIELNCARLVNEKPADDEADDNEPENTGDADTDSDTSEGDTDGNTDETDNSDDNSDGDEDAESTPESLKAELEDIALKAMEDPMGDDQKTKAILEALGKERYGFDVDKRKSVENVIDSIVEAAFKK